MGEVVINDGDASVESVKKAIKGADVAITSWGNTTLTKEILDECPDLKLVVHAAGTVKPIPQEQLLNKDEEPTPAPKIFKETCEIDFSRSAQDVYNHIRGLSPYPAAWTTIKDSSGTEFTLKIFETELPSDKIIGEPGTIKITKDTLTFACAGGSVEVKSLQLAGKKRMTTAEFLRGFK